jgi:predicted aspartyl protease
VRGVGEVKFDLLVDSGAAPNVLDSSTFLRMDSRPKLRQIGETFVAADGRALRVYGEVELDIVLGLQPLTVTFVVADLGGLQGILGMNFLAKQKCTLDLFQGFMNSENFAIRLHKKHDTGCYVLRLAEQVVLPPGL